MTEVGIPIDMVGGTSIGSLMGGIWADELNVTRFTQRAREFSMVGPAPLQLNSAHLFFDPAPPDPGHFLCTSPQDMASLWKKVLDLTYPVTAMFSGRTASLTHLSHDG